MYERSNLKPTLLDLFLDQCLRMHPSRAAMSVSPFASLSPHTPSNDNTSFTADIILPEENDLVRAEDIDDA